MGVSGVGSGSSIRIQQVNEDTVARAPASGLGQQQARDVMDAGAQYRTTNASPSLTYLPEVDDAPLALDVHRIITQAQQERVDDVKERALNAAAKLQDMIDQYNAAMERFREAQRLAQTAMNADAGQYSEYAFDAVAGASEAAALAEEMTELAADCGASAEMVAQAAATATADAAAALSQAEALSETAAAEVGAAAAGNVVLVEDMSAQQSLVDQQTVEQVTVEQANVEQANVEQLAVEQATVEQTTVEQLTVAQDTVELPTVEQAVQQATSLATQLTAATFVPANPAAAELAATSLTQIAATYNAATAQQLAPSLAYWTSLAEQELAAGATRDSTTTVAANVVASDQVTAGTVTQSATADTSATTTTTAPVALQSAAFWAIGDAGAVGTETIAGQAVTPEQYIQDKPLVFVTRTVDELRYVDSGESTSSYTVQVERQLAVSIGEAARELNLDAAQAATYLAQNGAYLIAGGTIGTSAEFEAANGRAPGAADRAYLVSAEATVSSGEGGDYHVPATYGTAQQHIDAVGHDIGVYEWLPADVIAAAQASTGGHVLLAASDQITTVQAHLDEQSMVFVEKLVNEYAADNYGEGGAYIIQVQRQVAVPTFQAAAELGLAGADLAAYADANRAYVLSDGTVGTRAAFEAAEKRAPAEADRAYIVASPMVYGGESGETSTPAQVGSQAAYLELIGLSTSTPRDLTISFNNSYSGDGDAYLDTSHRTLDLTQANTPASRAYHAVANDTLAGEWVQIGDKGPIGDDVGQLLGSVYEQFGADTPEKQEIVRGLLFRYDANYGVIANRALIEGAVEMNNNRRQGFFESGLGRAIVMVAATFVGGPGLAAGVSAAFTAYDGGSFGDIVRAGAAAYLGGAVGAGVGNFVTSSLASSGLSATAVAGVSGFAQGVSSSFTTQIITTGRIDADALLTAGVAGGVGGAVTTAVSGTDLVANIDRSLGLASGTTARLIGSQVGSLVVTGELNLESALMALGNGALNGQSGSTVVDGPPPATAELSEYEARGYTTEEAQVLRSMGFSPGVLPEVHGGETLPPEDASVRAVPATDPRGIRMGAVSNVYNTLSGNPSLTVEMRETPQGGQTIDIWTREGAQITYRFMNGELMGSQTNLDLIASGIGPRMAQVSGVADELRTNPNLTVRETTNYRTGAQQLLITSPGQPQVQYNYQDGAFVSVTYPDQLRATDFMVNDAVTRYGIPAGLARLWGDRAVAGESLVAAGIPADVAAMGQLATVAIRTWGPGETNRDGGSAVLAVANIDGVDRAVLITANHVLKPGETTLIAARDSSGRSIQISYEGQTMISTGIAGANGRVTMGETAASDGYLITLSPETLNALRPGVSLGMLPRVGAPPANGTPIYEFGFAAWGNLDAAGQYTAVNLVGATGSASGNSNGVVTTGMPVSNTNPPVTGGMSGGPVFVKMPDGSIQVVGVLQGSGPENRLGLVNQVLGTNFVSQTSAFASLEWLLYRGGPRP